MSRPDAITPDAITPDAITLDAIERILIIRMSALGDVIHVLPSLAALRERFPRARISWLVEPLGASILEGHPLLERLWIVDRRSWRRALRSPIGWLRVAREVMRLSRALRAQRFDLVLDFQCNARSGLAVALSGGRHRVGFAREHCRERLGSVFTNIHATPASALQNKVVKNLELVRRVGWSGEPPDPLVVVPPEDRQWARQVIGEMRRSGPAITIHPAVSAFGALKRWPVEHFSAYCRRLEDELDARVLLTWGPGEEPLVRSIGAGTVAPATTRLMRLAALIAESDLFVACDTGNLHLAAVLGVPVIGLYGPKNPAIYAPFRHRGRILRSGVPCSPCALRRCEHSICMSELRPETVFEATRDALETRGATVSVSG